MFLSNLHTHTLFSDGASTCEEYIQHAIKHGFVSLGFSEHQPTIYNCSVEITQENIPIYINKVNELKKKYAHELEVLLGMEIDVYGINNNVNYKKNLELDYTIGSVHYLKTPNGYMSVDHNTTTFNNLIQALNGIKNVAYEYYSQVINVCKFKPTILGHIDLITKFNGDYDENKFFGENEKWYTDITNDIVKEISKTDVIVEINTGAMSRGYRKLPYPHHYILQTLNNYNVPITISSDAHHHSNLNYGFTIAVALAKEAGYKSIKQYKNKNFIDLVIWSLQKHEEIYVDFFGIFLWFLVDFLGFIPKKS